ncbi:hypothetical protein [Bradyrhizobium sp. CCBAU 51753]|uniref:hypothetical protein n=1 Tax=Bradyrhizobium sp. CCBAU 51753 TaxID=1325100 RepID=UPI00188D13DF|nr:hypothetical protein [Bradyrhizobium sp. CCBAU 51753]
MATALGDPDLKAQIMNVLKNNPSSVRRRKKKDARIQLLENQLTESYDERVLAADRLAEAIHSTKTALEALTSEIRAKR